MFKNSGLRAAISEPNLKKKTSSSSANRGTTSGSRKKGQLGLFDMLYVFLVRYASSIVSVSDIWIRSIYRTYYICNLPMFDLHIVQFPISTPFRRSSFVNLNLDMRRCQPTPPLAWTVEPPRLHLAKLDEPHNIRGTFTNFQVFSWKPRKIMDTQRFSEIAFILLALNLHYFWHCLLLPFAILRLSTVSNLSIFDSPNKDRFVASCTWFLKFAASFDTYLLADLLIFFTDFRSDDIYSVFHQFFFYFFPNSYIRNRSHKGSSPSRTYFFQSKESWIVFLRFCVTCKKKKKTLKNLLHFWTLCWSSSVIFSTKFHAGKFLIFHRIFSFDVSFELV